MGEFRRRLENASVLLVVLLSAPLAALLAAVLLVYLIILLLPGASGDPAAMRDLFAMVYVVIYLTICFFAVKGT